MLLTLAACEAEPPEPAEVEVGEASSALLVGSTFEPWHTPPAWQPGATTCTQFYSVPGVLNANGQALQTLLNDVMKRGRHAAYSFAMLDCLADVMTVGNVTLLAENQNPWGPYCRPLVDPGCSANSQSAAYMFPGETDHDPYNTFELSSLSLQDARVAQARRVWTHGQSNNRIRLACHNPSQTNGPQTHISVSDHNEEVINLLGSEYQGLLNEWNSGDPARRTHARAYLAALIWHEALHGHGYDHGGSPVQRQQVPHIAGACLWQVLLDSSETVRTSKAQFDCIGTSCPGGALPVIQGFPGTSCTCIADPGVFTTNRVETDRGAPGPVVVDSGGVMYRKNGALIETYNVFTGWQTIFSGSPEEIYAGGDKVFYRKNGQLFRRDGAAWVLLGNVGTGVAIDDLGRAFTVAAGFVFGVRPGTTLVENYGGPFLGANRIFAGGDKLYATNISGNLYEFNGASAAGTWTQIGGPGNDFTVDSFGVIYRLSTNLLSVSAFRNNAWVLVGGAATGILAGNHLFARNAFNQVFELYPDGTWQLVTGSFSAWSAGGQRLMVQKSGTWRDFTHQGTSTIF